jgi:hypothetical protein
MSIEKGYQFMHGMAIIDAMVILGGSVQGLLSDGRGRPVPTGRGRTLNTLLNSKDPKIMKVLDINSTGKELVVDRL